MSAVDMAVLVEKARAGDQQACEALYLETCGQMLGLARSMLRQEEDAMDVLQESYLYAFKALDKLENPAYFSTWLYRIVANRCKNFLTRTRPKLFAASLSDEEGGQWDMEDEDLAFRPDETVDYSETKRLVKEMVDELPGDQRACVLLFYYQDLKVSRIAELLAVPENTVKSRLNYARKKLRQQAEALESRGTVLHSLALFPLLRMAFGEQTAQAFDSLGGALWERIAQGMPGAVAGAALSAASAAEGSAAAGGSAGGTAASAQTAAVAGGLEASATAGAATASAGGVAGSGGGAAAFFGTVTGKIATGLVIACVAVGGGMALQDAPAEPAFPTAMEMEEPVLWEELVESGPEEETEPEFLFVFNGAFGDQAKERAMEEFHLRVMLSAPCEVVEADADTGDIYVGIKPGSRFQARYTGINGQGAYAPEWQGDAVLEREDAGEGTYTYRVSGEGSGVLEFLWQGEGGSLVRSRIHLGAPGAPPRPQASQPSGRPVQAPVAPEPEPAAEPEPEEPPVAAAVSEQDEGAPSRSRRQSSSASERSPSRSEPETKQEDSWEEESRQASEPSSQGQVESSREESTEESQKEAEQDDGFYGVSFRFIDEDGNNSSFRFLGIELNDKYAVIYSDEALTGQSGTYGEMQRSRGLTLLTPAEAAELGLVKDVSYGSGTVAFSTTADKYGVHIQDSAVGFCGRGRGKGSASHHSVTQLFQTESGGNVIREV